MWTRRKKYLRHVAEVLEAILFFHFIRRVDVSSCKVSYLAKYDVRQLCDNVLGLGARIDETVFAAVGHCAVVGAGLAGLSQLGDTAGEGLVARREQHREFADGHFIVEAQLVVREDDGSRLCKRDELFKQRIVAPDIRKRALLHQLAHADNAVAVLLKKRELLAQRERDRRALGHVVAVLLEDDLSAEEVWVLFERLAHRSTIASISA